MILTMNNFTFNQQHYLQIHGTAMGTKMAPSFANSFLVCSKPTISLTPLGSLTYGGDISMIFS